MNAEKLNAIRKEKGLSIEELSNLANLPKSTVEKILFGVVKHPRIDTMQAIENALGLSTEWTAEEVKAGVGDHPVTLSQEEKEILALFDELERIKGTAYKNAILDLIRSVIYAENKD